MLVKNKMIYCIFMVATFVLVGCSNINNGTDKNNDNDTSINMSDEKETKDKFWEAEVTDDIIAIIINRYTDEQYKSLGNTIKVTLDDNKEKFLLIPTEDDTNIEIWSVESSDGKVVEKEVKYKLESAKKNSIIEVEGIRSEGSPNYKIKVINKKGSLDYLLTYDGKNGTQDIEYLVGELTDSRNKENEKEDDVKKELNIGMFIPNGNYEMKYEASDLVSNNNYIKGNGTSYQVVGVSGKGPFVNVYTKKDNGIYMMYKGDLTEEEINNIDKIDYLSENDENEDKTILSEPIKVGTRWDNKEIVEIGENLKLGDLALEGAYIKTWEKSVSEGKEFITVYYYSEGLGCVQHRVIVDEAIVEYSVLKEVIKK